MFTQPRVAEHIRAKNGKKEKERTVFCNTVRSFCGGGGGSTAPDAMTILENGGDHGLGEARTICQRDETALNLWTKAPYVVWSSIDRMELNKGRQERLINSDMEIDRCVVRALRASWGGSTAE